MRKDPAIEEIRQTRKDLSREHESTEAFLDHYRALEKEYESKMLTSRTQKQKSKMQA